MDLSKQLVTYLSRVPLLLFAVDSSENLMILEGGELSRLGLNPGDGVGYSVFKNKNLPISRSMFRNVMKGKSLSNVVEVAGIFYETSYSPLRNSKSEIIGCSCFSVDVTKIIELENIIEQEQQNASRIRQLESLAGMANGIAHEVNNPLAIISGFSQQLERLASSKEIDKEYLSKIGQKLVATTTRIKKIITGLKNFSREAGNEAFTFVLVRDILENSLEACRTRFNAASISANIEGVGYDIVVECREAQLFQVFLNIFINSMDAIKDQESPWVEVKAEKGDDNIKIYLTDSGEGIPSSVEGKVFEPFFTTREVGAGTGLGLSTAKGLIENHKGTIEILNDTKNTTFLITLPRVQEKDKLVS